MEGFCRPVLIYFKSAFLPAGLLLCLDIYFKSVLLLAERSIAL